MDTCSVIRASAPYSGKHGLTYFEGISLESAGAKGLCLHLVVIPPLARAVAHLHEGHETAIYMLEGVVEMLYGANLEKHAVVGPGDYVHIPAGVPHCPWNPSEDTVARGVVARTDPNQKESLVLRPDLESVVEAWLQSHNQKIQVPVGY